MIEFIRKHYGKLGMSFALVMLVINYFQRQELTRLRNEPKIEVFTGGDIEKGKIIDSLQNRIDSLQNLSDSLYNENYPCQIQLGRYEMAYHILLERNPKAAKQYGDIISNETE